MKTGSFIKMASAGWTACLPALAFCLLLISCSGNNESEVADPGTNEGVAVSITSFVPASGSVESTFQDLAGNPVELEDYRGKKVFLNFWGTWCAPCIREIPSINRAREILGEGYVFLLASDESLQQIAGFRADHEFDGNFIKLNTDFANYGIQAVPSTILYDENGEVIKRWLGSFEWDSPEMLAQLRAM